MLQNYLRTFFNTHRNIHIESNIEIRIIGKGLHKLTVPGALVGQQLQESMTLTLVGNYSPIKKKHGKEIFLQIEVRNQGIFIT